MNQGLFHNSCCKYPVFPVVFKLLLESLDLLLENMNPLSELGGGQLLSLVVAGAEG